MKSAISSIPVVLFVLFVLSLLAPPCRAGEPAPPETKPEAAAPGPDARLEALEKRIRLLEQGLAEKDARIAELQRKQQQEDAQGPGNMTGPGFRFQLGPEDTQRLQDRLDQYLRRNLDELFEPRTPHGGFDLNDEDWMNRRDPLFERDNPWSGAGRLPAPARKPRLGVALETANDDLRSRYRNEAKEGAFVTGVTPQSPADKAGLLAGDCIASVDGKAIRSAAELVDAIQDAAEGRHKLMVVRRGEEINLEVALERAKEERAGPGGAGAGGGGLRDGGWMRRPQDKEKTNRESRDVTEVRSGALELTSELAKELKLDDKQRKQAEEILTAQGRKLGEEYAARSDRPGRLGRRGLSGADLRALVDEHVATAEKGLKEVFNAEQLKGWREYSDKHKDDIFISRHMQIQERQGGGGGGGGGKEENLNF